MNAHQIFKQIVIALLFALVLGGAIALDSATPARAAMIEDNALPGPQSGFQLGEDACTCSGGDTLNCTDFADQQEAQSCFSQCLVSAGFDVHDLDADGDGSACEDTDYSSQPPPQSEPVPEEPVEEPTAEASVAPEIPGANNLVFNGNFEFGFYQVPELGFEPPHVGNVPNNWNWYKSQTYGKFNIYNNQAFGLVCPDNAAPPETTQESVEDSIFGPIPGLAQRPRPNNSLSLHMQSTDQQDARLGVYQVIDVVPGQDYRLTMSGTVQVQSGATTLQPDDPKAPEEAQNHTIEVSFDHTGGTNWRAIPLEKRTIWELEEQKLEFKVSETDEDIAQIQDFETTVRARSDKMTLFITGWRKWANWRTAIFTIDCVSLVPIDAAGNPIPVRVSDAAAAAPEPESEPDAGQSDVQPAAMAEPAEPQPETEPAPEESTVIIPPSGGILEKAGNSILFIVASLVIIVGLVGAGVWNMRR